jgi:aspartyl aminopeptidase
MLTQAMVTRSFVVSMDMAHGVHPNYAEKHEILHRPQLQQGLVIKTNSNQRYATNTVSSYFIRSSCAPACCR